MDILIHTTEGCTYCDHMKELCVRAGVEYKTNNTPQDELLKKYPNCQGYPYVIIDGEVIGGLVETAKLFLKEGLVSAIKG